MRRYLLPKEGRFYKANLHCHTTVSDGKLTPEEIKELYIEDNYPCVKAAETTKITLVTDHRLRLIEKRLRGKVSAGTVA